MLNQAGLHGRLAAPYTSLASFLPCQLQDLQHHASCVHKPGQGGPVARQRSSRRGRGFSAARSALEEADWEQEMSLFRKRLQKPNQLETLRKIVEEVDTGKVCPDAITSPGLDHCSSPVSC